MKKKLSLLLIAAMLICLSVPPEIGAITYGVSVIVNGQSVDYSGGYGEPFLSDEGRTMVPVRGTAEAYGCTVEWDGANYQAIVAYENHYVIIPINQSYVITDFGTVKMDTWARIIENRTYLPIRYVMEAVGAEVGWIASSRTVTIQAPEIVSDTPPEEEILLPSVPAEEPFVPPLQTVDQDRSLVLLRESLKTRGKYNSSSGYVYQETTPSNSSLVSYLVYDPAQDVIYVLIEMDLDGSSGERRSSLRLNISGSSYTTAYYSFSMLNAGTEFDWSGHFEKARYTDAGSYVIDRINSAAKDIGASLVLNSLAVYQNGLAIEAVDRYCRSSVSGVTAQSLGFSQ